MLLNELNLKIIICILYYCVILIKFAVIFDSTEGSRSTVVAHRTYIFNYSIYASLTRNISLLWNNYNAVLLLNLFFVQRKGEKGVVGVAVVSDW